MKITFFIQDFSGGGAQHMIINSANEFARRGDQIDLLVVNDYGPHKDKVEEGVNIVDLNKNRSLAALWQVARYLREQQPDIFLSALTHSNILSVLAKLLAPLSRTKIILTERTFLSEHLKATPHMSDKALLIGVKLFYRFADKVIGISKGVTKDIQNLADLRDEQVGYIYNPVITPQTRAQLEEDAVPSLGAESEAVIITSGRLSFEKDQETLLKAFAKLREGQLARLVILGGGPLRAELESQAKTLKISEYVDFVGFVPNSLAYMKAADLFVISSLYEGFCNTIVEALFCGLSVVSTNAPSGPEEILNNGEYGILTPVGDADALAEAMRQTLRRPFDAQKQQERALCFTVEKICDEYEALFKSLLKD